MKANQLAVLFGGTALAAQPLAAPRVERALTDTHSMVVMVTSTHLVSEICTDIASCPPYTTTAQTSVVYVTATTTICLLSSTPPGYGPPATTAISSPFASSAYPIESGVISVSIIPGSSILPTGSEYSSGFAPQTSALPTVISSSAYATPPAVSVITQSESYHGPVIVTITSVYSLPGSSGIIVVPSSTTIDVISTSYYVSSAGPSSIGFSSGYVAPPGSSLASSYTNPAPMVPGSSVASSVLYPGSIPSGSSANPPHSNTDVVPTSVITPSSGPSSDNLAAPSTPGYLPSGPAIPSGGSAAPTSSSTAALPTSLTVSLPGVSSAGPSSSRLPTGSEMDAIPTSFPSGGSSVGASSDSYFVPSGTATGSLGTISGTHPATTPATSGYPSPAPPTGPDSTVIESTIRITSYQTQTFTSYITAGPSSGGPGNNTNTNTNTQAIPTSFPSSVSGGPSGSGYPHPSGGINGTIIAPSPSYIEVPINTGHIVGAGKSPLAAIVVALIFAHFA